MIGGKRIELHFLSVGETVVASVSQRVPGDWAVRVNRHLPISREGHAIAPTLSVATRWVERWAATNADRLRSASMAPKP